MWESATQGQEKDKHSGFWVGAIARCHQFYQSDPSKKKKFFPFPFFGIIII